MAKVLLVHDNDEAMSAIRRAARRAGYLDSEIVEAGNEDLAIERIRAHSDSISLWSTSR